MSCPEFKISLFIFQQTQLGTLPSTLITHTRCNSTLNIGMHLIPSVLIRPEGLHVDRLVAAGAEWLLAHQYVSLAHPFVRRQFDVLDHAFQFVDLVDGHEVGLVVGHCGVHSVEFASHLLAEVVEHFDFGE